MVQNVDTTAKSVIGGRRATNKRSRTTTGWGEEKPSGKGGENDKVGAVIAVIT